MFDYKEQVQYRMDMRHLDLFSNPMAELDRIQQYMLDCNKCAPIFTSDNFHDLHLVRYYHDRELKMMTHENVTSFVPPSYTYTLDKDAETITRSHETFLSCSKRTQHSALIPPPEPVGELHASTSTSSAHKQPWQELAAPPTPSQ